jgi:hypothetical protein
MDTDVPVVTFVEEDHSYWMDGRRVPSVTQILELAALTVDYSTIPAATLAHARERGSHVDLCCDLYDQDDLDWTTVHPECVPYVKAWAAFRERERFTPTLWQHRVYHERLEYAGTIDAYGDGVLVERKCTSKLSPSYAIQTALYAMAMDFPDRWIVQLKKDGSYVLVDGEAEANRIGRCDYEAAAGAVAVARWKLQTNGRGK